MIEQADPPPEVSRRLSAVMFVDIVDSVALIQHDPEGTIARWRTFVAAITHEELPPRHGRIVKLLGDGMLVEFTTAANAVECAVSLQSRIERANEGVDRAAQLALRIGVHVADVMADALDLYGDGVNLAARLMSIAGPRETIISAAARDQVTDGLGVQLEDLGDQWLKGIERPVRAFRAWPPNAHPVPVLERRRNSGSRPSIAILPFRDLSLEPVHALLGDMLADDLIGAVSRQTDLFVISRLSTAPFRNRLYEPRNVGQLLGVRYVLSGTMQTAGSRLRLVAELTEAEVGRVIWADRFEGSLVDIFELEDRLSREILERVIPLVRQRELQRARAKRPESLTAYERMLRAIDAIHRSSPDELEGARQMLEAAIASDSQYPAPYAWLAFLYVRRIGQGWSLDRDADQATANRLADAALERDETDAWVLSVSGLVTAYLNGEAERALPLFDRALTINPSAGSAWIWSTTALAWLDRGSEAIERAPRAIELSPFDPNMYSFTSMSAVAHAVAGDYDRAVELSRVSLRQNAMFASTHRTLAIALALADRTSEARVAAKRLLELEPKLTVRSFLQRYPGRHSQHAPRWAAALADAGVPP